MSRSTKQTACGEKGWAGGALRWAQTQANARPTLCLVTNVLTKWYYCLHGCLRPPIALPQWQHLASVRATVRLG